MRLRSLEVTASFLLTHPTDIVFYHTQFLGFSYNFSLKSIKIIPINIAIDEGVEKLLNLLKYGVF